jgi:hypothetical protein
MITKSYIYGNLKSLNTLYNQSSSSKKGLFYSKLALLELCGWIEESMDDIIRRCAKKNLRNQSNLIMIENDIIRKTFGFEYNQHFRKMLVKTLGLIKLEKLEKKFDPLKFQLLETTLETLKSARNNEAHTHIKGITRRIDAPSVTISRFLIVYDGLLDIDDLIKRCKFRI